MYLLHCYHKYFIPLENTFYFYYILTCCNFEGTASEKSIETLQRKNQLFRQRVASGGRKWSRHSKRGYLSCAARLKAYHRECSREPACYAIYQKRRKRQRKTGSGRMRHGRKIRWRWPAGAKSVVGKTRTGQTRERVRNRGSTEGAQPAVSSKLKSSLKNKPAVKQACHFFILSFKNWVNFGLIS